MSKLAALCRLCMTGTCACEGVWSKMSRHWLASDSLLRRVQYPSLGPSSVMLTVSIPAAASACPADDFAADSASGRSREEAAGAARDDGGGEEGMRHASAAFISMGSPRAVPVPCIWRVPTCAVRREAWE